MLILQLNGNELLFVVHGPLTVAVKMDLFLRGGVFPVLDDEVNLS